MDTRWPMAPRTWRRTGARRGSPRGTGGTSWLWGLTSRLNARTPTVGWNGQGKAERGPMAHLTLDPDSSPVQLHKLLGQRQAESRPLLLAGVVPPDLAELLEDGGLILGRDPDSRV